MLDHDWHGLNDNEAVNWQCPHVQALDEQRIITAQTLGLGCLLVVIAE